MEAPDSSLNVSSFIRFKPLDSCELFDPPPFLPSLPFHSRFAWLSLRNARPPWDLRLTRHTTYTPPARARPGAALPRTTTSPPWRSQAEGVMRHTRFTRGPTLVATAGEEAGAAAMASTIT